MTSWDDLGWRARIEARADDPQVQELIRRAIRSGAIRVRPVPGGGIRITPRVPPGAPRRP